MKKNIILVTMDEVRHDHLSCYGYRRVQTPHIDRFAREGVRFETAVSTSCFTPVSHATILTGVYPLHHNLRDPFSGVEWKIVAEIFKENGYKTAGFVGVNLLGKANRFDVGFDYFDEPSDDEIWKRSGFAGDGRGELLWGNWWIPRMLKWVRDHQGEPFFIWTHYFDTHQAAEDILLEMGKIQRGIMPDYGYYDPKIKYMDEAYFGPLHQLLQELDLEERTTILITSDHGTNMGEHKVPPFPHLKLVYPQHTTLYDCDLLVPMIIQDKDLPKGVVIPGVVRTVDIVPTLVDLAGIENRYKFDGISLVPFVKRGRAERLLAYSEELYEKRGPGDFQSVRSDRYKFIIDHRTGLQEFFDLLSDKKEQQNLIFECNEEQEKLIEEWRKICQNNLERKGIDYSVQGEAKEKIEKRLRSLGYIA
jgi:arylsulfatase A-like enzyme